MSSPITLSGFNNIDFGQIIDAILAQERIPLGTLEDQKTSQQARLDAYNTLGSKLASIASARTALAGAGAFEAVTAEAGDAAILSASAGLGAQPGTHTIQVTALAAAQVLASSSTTAATDTTVADAGSLTVGSQTYAVTGATSLLDLRDRINADPSAVARASLIDTGTGFRLVLTAKDTGTAAAFTVQNNLTLGGATSPLAFTDTDGDGTSGDDAADNAVVASDASLLIDNISVTRSSNAVTGGLAGVDLTLEAVGTTSLTVAADTDTVKTRITSLVDAYNAFSSFMQEQLISSGGSAGPLAGDSIARSVSDEIRSVLRSSVDSGGAFRSLAEIGIRFDRTGQLVIDETELDAALATSAEDVRKLFQTSFESTDSRVRGTGSTSATIPGTYTVDITSLASPATVSGSTPINNKINQDETLAFTYGALTASIFLPKNSTVTEVVTLLSSGLTTAGIPVLASESGGALVLSTTAKGSAESFTVVSDVADNGNGKSTGIGTTLLSANGTDIAGTLGGLAATGTGEVLTGAAGGATEGLTVEVLTSTTGAHGTLTVTGGIADKLDAVLDRYLGSTGLLTSAETRIDDAIGSLNERIADMEERLVLREQELRFQFTAADKAISTLNAQMDSLGSLFGGGSL